MFMPVLACNDALPCPACTELEEVGIFAFEYLIVKPFEHENLSDVLARTYWSTRLFTSSSPL
jgi:hypothetical protein